jgi:hypothetical protein
MLAPIQLLGVLQLLFLEISANVALKMLTAEVDNVD